MGEVPPSYHHGDLPAALRAATADLVAERGPTGFSLREVARRAGVSHAAPRNHFGTAQGLLTSVAAEGFETLREAFEAATDAATSAEDRLNRIGRAYVDTALRFPGHFGVMMQNDLIDGAEPAFLEASAATYGLLVAAVEAVRDELNPDLDVDTATALAWSSIHGLVELSPKFASMADLHAAPTGPLDTTVARFTKMLISGFERR